MSVNLQKGQKVDLTKGNAGLKTILVGLGWDEAPRKFSLFSRHEDIDCDASAFLIMQRKQHFGMIKNAFIRLVDADKGVELCRYNLSENYEGKTAMIFGEIYLYNGEWKFNAIGEPTNDNSISELAARYQR